MFKGRLVLNHAGLTLEKTFAVNPGLALMELWTTGPSLLICTLIMTLLVDKASPDEKEDFRAEINFMKMIGKHENIITILGCCTLYDPVCLLVEYAPHGDLLHYLRDLRKKVNKKTLSGYFMSQY